MCQSLFLVKLLAWACSFIKKRLWHRCFPVNFAISLRTTFFIEHLRWLLLPYVSSDCYDGGCWLYFSRHFIIYTYIHISLKHKRKLMERLLVRSKTSFLCFCFIWFTWNPDKNDFRELMISLSIETENSPWHSYTSVMG